MSDLLFVSKTVIMKLVDKLIKDYDSMKVNINKSDQSVSSLLQLNYGLYMLILHLLCL